MGHTDGAAKGPERKGGVTRKSMNSEDSSFHTIPLVSGVCVGSRASGDQRLCLFAQPGWMDRPSHGPESVIILTSAPVRNITEGEEK